MSTSRILSLIIALVYVTMGVQAGGLEGGLRFAIFCLFPCACIWFPEPMADYTGDVLTKITKGSPPSFVFVLGWIVLLVPFIGLGFMWLETVGTH
jgi:hypothetical protein